MSSVACSKCGASIQRDTAERNGGLCMPCKRGTRASIDASYETRRRERELDQTDPIRLLWRTLAAKVHANERGYQTLLPDERSWFAVEELSREVHNGGFDQYFFNSSGAHVDDALIGLHEMGAAHCLELLQRAKQTLFGDARVPTSTAERRGWLLQSHVRDRVSDLEQLDRQMWKEAAELDASLLRYARERRLV